MNPESFARVRAAFDEALARAEGAERAVFVAGVFGGADEAELRELLGQMLEDAEPGFLEPPSPLTIGGSIEAAVALTAGTQLGDFVLVRLIGSGGMGDVWEARQEQPARRVAVKVLRVGLVSDRARSRFAEEAELLARLSHPGIARVFASGVLEDERVGLRPWFAMELIEGATDLVSFARELPLGQRLERVAEVADAVHHGHLRGVVHRDLKPENLLVDSEGRVHVIDFGIARASSAEGVSLGETVGGELLGTLAYMSPEQVLGDKERIDVRTDVHALGVLLYELLVGSSPWSAGGSSWAALAREVTDVDPRPPSACKRGLSVELDWIVARALAKDPERRYASVAAFGDDLRRFLRHEPLAAGPPSLAYQLSKFVRRNRAWVIGGSVAVLLLVLGTIGTGFGLLQSRERGRKLELAATQAERRGLELEQANVRAEERANRAAAMNEFLDEMLRLGNPLMAGGGGEVTVGEMLERAAERVGSAFPGRPDLEAETRLLIGVSLDGQGRYAAALEQLRLARDHFEATGSLEVIRATRMLAAAEAHTGNWQAAYDEMRAAHARGTEQLDADDPERGALDSDLAWILQEVGKVEESVPLARAAIDRWQAAGPEYAPVRANAASLLARSLRALGNDAETEAAYKEAIALHEGAYGEDSVNAGVAAANFGAFLYSRGRTEDARELFERAYELERKGLDPNHPMLATVLYNLSAALQDLELFDEAEVRNLECLALLERTLGPEHPETADARGGLALLYYDMGRYDEALAGFEAYVKDLEGFRGPDNSRTWKMRVRVLETRVRLGDEPAARELAALFERFEAERGPEDSLTQYVLTAAGRVGLEF